jgi:hypothetical protein
MALVPAFATGIAPGELYHIYRRVPIRSLHAKATISQREMLIKCGTESLLSTYLKYVMLMMLKSSRRSCFINRLTSALFFTNPINMVDMMSQVLPLLNPLGLGAVNLTSLCSPEPSTLITARITMPLGWPFVNFSLYIYNLVFTQVRRLWLQLAGPFLFLTRQPKYGPELSSVL